ncbi:AP-3 complex subunit sigma [Physcia stellaris]|nr:AP-3 complex subunit sigma [Physcia stellaris]
MSSDEAYSSFLDQANQDTGVGKTSTQSSSATAKAIDTDVPASLQKIEQYYQSEADEPFEPVSLSWDGNNMPSENEFKELLAHKSEVSTLTTQDFDPKGHYKEVLEAVEKAGDGRARVFRVHHGSTRAEYYVVGLDKKGKKVVGLKARAVES